MPYLVMAGVVLYVALDIITQLLPPHYNPITRAESDLAVGPYGWVMRLNFVVRGLLSVALLMTIARNISSRTNRARVALAAWAIWSAGAFVLALFNTDLGATERSLHGKIHLAVALVAFLSVVAAELLLSRCLTLEPRWNWRGRWATILAIVTTVAFLFMGVLAKAHIGGLTERIFLGSVLAWAMVVAIGFAGASHETPTVSSSSAESGWT
jgi:hypothetical protein